VLRKDDRLVFPVSRGLGLDAILTVQAAEHRRRDDATWFRETMAD
jgi:hypothetical protein